MNTRLEKLVIVELRFIPDGIYGVDDSNRQEKGGHPNRC
jgi:hypothetical protein